MTAFSRVLRGMRMEIEQLQLSLKRKGTGTE